MRIRINTGSEAKRFAEIAAKIPGRVVIKDRNGLCVNAKSVLGVLHAIEFDELYCESENEIYAQIRDFVIED